MAERFRALSQPARQRILQTLCNGELCVGDLEEVTDLNQANLSRHLRTLTDNGLVERRKEGLVVYYDLADPQRAQALRNHVFRVDAWATAVLKKA